MNALALSLKHNTRNTHLDKLLFSSDSGDSMFILDDADF